MLLCQQVQFGIDPNSAPVVEQHVFVNFFRCLPAGGEVRRIHAFHLQRTEETLRAGVVVRAAGAAHALKAAVVGHGAAEVCDMEMMRYKCPVRVGH